MLQENRTENFEVIEEHPETIPSAKIVVFSLKNDNPKFLNSREIIYNNEMYDIIYQKDSGNDTIFYCVNDDRDTKLHTAFRSLNQIKDNPARLPDHFAASVLKNLLKNYLPNPDLHLFENYKFRQFCLLSSISIQPVILEKISPPPQPQIIS
jgi:hypothetical protein